MLVEDYDIDELEDGLYEEELDFFIESGDTLSISAEDCLIDFFNNRELQIGGPIPTATLLDRINLLSLSMETCLQAIYHVPSDKIISILNECFKSGIPKYFAGGIMLIYLELCEGLEI